MSEKKPFLSDAVYNKLKQTNQLLLPAIGTLYFALAAIWDLPHADGIVATCAAFATFFGVILEISKRRYDGSDDGALIITEPEVGKLLYSLELTTDLADLEKKDEVKLRVPPTVAE